MLSSLKGHAGDELLKDRLVDRFSKRNSVGFNTVQSDSGDL